MSDHPVSAPSSRSTSFLERRLSLLSVSRRGTESSEDLRGPLGLTLLHAPPEPLIDFIFVHGLRGGSRKTWSKSEDLKHFWPQQWLPSEPGFKNVRIHSFGYNSDWGERKGSALTIHDFGQALIGDIHNSPHICGSNADTPIILVGHSMGGVVIKKAFVLSTQDPNYRSLQSRIHSMFFLATPHRGADSAQLLSNIIRLSFSHNPKAYVGELVPNSGAIQAVNDEFRHVYGDTQLWSFFETIPSSMGLIVDKASAVIGLPGERSQYLNADHRHVCKFEGPSDANYCTLRNAFISTINSIEKAWGSLRKDEHRAQMRTLSQYLGITERPEVDLTSVLEKRVDGSCEWLTNSEPFLDWTAPARTNPKYFWLTGGPATGKSTISGYVITYLEEYHGDCMYFFFKDGDPVKSNVSEMLRSLAWQMALTNVEVRQALLEMEQEGIPVDKTDARSVWRAIYASRICHIQLRQPCYWVIDALDECSSLSILFPFLSKINENFPLRMFMTSRLLPSIERLFTHEKLRKFSTMIDPENSRSDIQLVLHANSHYLPVDDDSEREQLTAQILDKSKGNFLWVSLVLKELIDIRSKQQIHDVLRSVPEEMDGLYSRIIQNLMADTRNKHLAQAVLKWTVFASRPLKLDELNAAMALDIGETLHKPEVTIAPLCGHLVYVDAKGRIQVAHQTVRGFLLGAKGLSDFRLDQQTEHARLSGTCLKYLCGDEMRSSRYRRGSQNAKSIIRSSFAQYAAVHFSDHLMRSGSSNDEQFVALDSFFQTNSLTWIELIAQSGDLGPLIQTANNLNSYLERRAKYSPPVNQGFQNISAWSRDLVQLVARFGKALVSTPHAIHFLIPPVCPAESIIARTFKDYPRALQTVGLAQTDWDDQLCCIGLPKVRTLSIACRDNKLAIGATDGFIRIFSATTFQEEMKLLHGERVQSLVFGYTNIVLASAGRLKIKLWDSTSGTLVQSLNLPDQILAFDFSVDNSQLMVATKANCLQFWGAADGVEIENWPLSDVDEAGHELKLSSRHSPTHAAFSAELNLLAVTCRQRPVILWDLRDGEYVGQLHNNVAAKYEAFTFAVIFNSNVGLGLAAVAYDDGKIVTFDVWNQQRQRSTKADAMALASSPDGTILAACDASSVITLFEFETLKTVYRIISSEQSIKMMVFGSNNTRFFDIRGDHCNVWEPPVLVQHTNLGETSSIDVSEAVSAVPQLGKTHTYDDDRTITAIRAHHEGKVVFCGREDGTVAAYSTATGEVMNELYSHKYVAVLFIKWSEAGTHIASADRSGRIIVREITGIVSGNIKAGSTIFDQKMSSPIDQLLLSPNGKKLLVSLSQTDQLWDVQEAVLSCTLPICDRIGSRRWITNPSDPDRILLFNGTRVEIFDWKNLNKISQPAGIDLGFGTDSSQFFFSKTNHQLCISHTGSRKTGLPATLRLLFTRTLALQVKTSDYSKLAKTIKTILGYYGPSLVFLTDDGWICSMDISDSARIGPGYLKHFFIPLNLHSTAEGLMSLVTMQGSIVLVRQDEVLVFQNGMSFEEQVGFESRTNPSRPAPKLSIRRKLSGDTPSSSSRPT